MRCRQAALSDHLEPGHINSFVQLITPVVEEARQQPGDIIHNAVVLNVNHMAGQLRASEPLLKKPISSGRLHVIGAVYDLDTGRVQFFPEIKDQAIDRSFQRRLLIAILTHQLQSSEVSSLQITFKDSTKEYSPNPPEHT
ncbi:MAG: carbonic anhydrase [bacterium]|nr:carbonic anhydrase [bacterium]